MEKMNDTGDHCSPKKDFDLLSVLKYIGLQLPQDCLESLNGLSRGNDGNLEHLEENVGSNGGVMEAASSQATCGEGSASWNQYPTLNSAEIPKLSAIHYRSMMMPDESVQKNLMFDDDWDSLGENFGHYNAATSLSKCLEGSAYWTKNLLQRANPVRDDCNESDDLQPSRARTGFTQSVFKTISLKNKFINLMTTCQLEDELAYYGLQTEGLRRVLKKRLKTYHRNQLLKRELLTLEHATFQYYIIINFEVTCRNKQSTSEYRMEIIEFPAVVVNARTLEICNVFHSYVRPLLHPKLSKHCSRLTGITQEQVDNANVFPVVLDEFVDFLNTHNYESFVMVSDGPSHFGRFLFAQVKWCGLRYPTFARRWLNLKKAFGNYYGLDLPTIADMLHYLRLPFQGTRQSGIDDAKNLASIFIQMLKDGALLRMNERIDLSSLSSDTLKPIESIVKSFLNKTKKQAEENDGEEICIIDPSDADYDTYVNVAAQLAPYAFCSEPTTV